MAEAGTDPLVFDALLTHLRQQGFDIGVDHYLRLQELLGKAGAECAPENLKTLLCPIFATNNIQQEQFYRAFDSYFALFRPLAPESAPPAAAEAEPTVPPSGARLARDRSWLYLLAAAGLVLIALLVVWRNTLKPATLAGAETARNIPLPQASDEPQLPTQTIWSPRGTIESSPATPPGQSAQPSFYPHLGEELYGLVTLWLAILAPLLLFLFYDQPPRSARPRSKLYARLRFISFWAALLTQPLLWLALRGVEELWWFWDSRAWLAILALLLFFLFYRQVPQDASPKSSRYERWRAPLLWLAALASLGLFLYGLMFHWAALCAPLIFLIIYEWHQYKRRQLLLQKQRGRKPPFVWPVRLRAFAPRLFDSDLFYRAARLMRRRQTDEHYQLDIDATVTATADALGYPTFRYKLATRPPEYLVLIDRASFRDHQAHLYNELAKALEREGNFVMRYFYDADPRVCCGEAGGDCLSLMELHSKFAGHRLLVFGDGAGLLDPITGRLASWTSIFVGWPERTLLTPAPPALWGFREVTLAGLVLVLPASLAGLLTLVTHFESLTETDVRAWRASSTDRPPALDNEPAEVIVALRAYLGDSTFQWLCACAVYPELHWDLTLYLGALPVMGGDLIREENLLRLARLPWFRAGSIPDELRWLLLRELDPEKERAIRLAIIELLERDPPPRETYAADAHQLNLVVQRWLSRRDRQRRRELLAALQSTPQQQVLRDYTLLRFLESASPSPLNIYLPTRLRHAFYQNGIPAFGLKTGARLLLALVIIAAGLMLREYASSAAVGTPPAANQAQVGQQAATRQNMMNRISIEFVWIPPGNFIMGSSSGDADEMPMHQVTISKGFFMGKYEVTQAQWQAVMGTNPSNFKGNNLPVEKVSWDDTVAFIAKLNAQGDGYTYRLPSEAEWEYAARAGTTGDYAGDLDAMAWYENNSSDETHLVGSKQPNAFGLFDIHGNVWEWCQDWYQESYVGAPTDGSAWLSGEEQQYRVSRGGSWSEPARSQRSANRWQIPIDDPSYGDLRIGLRVVAVVNNAVPTSAVHDNSKFSHALPQHASLNCSSCHQRPADNSVEPGFPQHKDCISCHQTQFTTPNTPLCTICHTTEGLSQQNPPLKKFPRLKSFNTKFDHRQHSTGAAHPTNDCATCHQSGGGRVLSTVQGFAAHAACYTCHTPNAQAGGRGLAPCGVCHVPSWANSQ